MSRITLDLLRKRSEHNEGEISTLEEIALHQENIEKIELIDKTCRHLKILLLQHNLVSKIENLGKLKRLEYLNLALNNIEEIENLEGLESLKKLDLTVNFIGNLRGIKKLRCNEHLEQLFLMGNPCTDYEGYREYAIATLIQLKELDGTPIERSERIKALQVYARIEGEIIRNCRRHEKAREAELLDLQKRTRSREVAEEEEKEEEEFWNQPSGHTPEERVAIAHRFLRKQERKEREKDGGTVPRITHKLKLFDSEGKPYNANQPKIAFKLDDERYSDRIVLEVALYKYLDTSYVDVDVHPDYVRVTIKGKVLQLTLPSEVSVNDSTAQRNTITGSLLVTMPRLKRLPTICPRSTESTDRKPGKTRPVIERRSATSVREYLEIGPVASDLDFSKIYTWPTDAVGRSVGNQEETRCLDEDDSMVPPLE